eukprot:m.79489 g.79489  ORF g.79489 m.79489 type:complete len:63 (-) comp25220_c1_seq1:28-216(-)
MNKRRRSLMPFLIVQSHLQFSQNQHGFKVFKKATPSQQGDNSQTSKQTKHIFERHHNKTQQR